MANQILIVKKNGEIENKEDILKQIDLMLNTARNGEHFMKLEKAVRQRSISQNKLMWLWFACIQQETGTDKIDIHDYYCKKFLRRVVTLAGKEEVVVSGTSKLSTEQFKDFLDKVQVDAASELGIKLPNPEDEYWRQFEEYYKRYAYA